MSEGLFALAGDVDPIGLHVEPLVTLDEVIQPAKGADRGGDSEVHGSELRVPVEGSRGALHLTSESGCSTQTRNGLWAVLGSNQ